MRFLLVLIVLAVFGAWGYGLGSAFGQCRAGLAVPAEITAATMVTTLPGADLPGIGPLILNGFSTGRGWFCG